MKNSIYPRLLLPIAFLLIAADAIAQQPTLDFQQNSSTINSYSHSEVQNPVIQGLNCDPPEEVFDNGRPFFTLQPSGNIWGGAHTYIKRGNPGCKISAQGTGNILIKNNGGNKMYVQWWCHSNTQYDCYDPDCPWFARDTSSVNARVVIQIGGLPTGTPVNVSYDWKHFTSIANEPEAISEDNAEVQGTSLNLFNRVGFGQGMNLNGIAKFAQKRTGDSLQTFNMVAGDSLVIDVSATTLAYIFPPPYTPQYPREDDASSDFFGFVNIYVNAQGNPLPIPVDSCPNTTLLFSADVGGDTEISDPTADGNEVLDPGDLYAQGVSAATPFFNDSLIFNADPAPSVGNPAGTCVPGPNQQWQHVLNFDLDGADRIDYNLFTNVANYGLGKPSIPSYNTDCVYSPEYALLSYDEDRGINLSSAINCNVPSSFALMDTSLLKGTPAGSDEVMSAMLTNILGSANYQGTAAPYLDEVGVAPVLSPAPPDISLINVNDDVDALDFVSDLAACGVQYFSVDHEAHYIHNNDTLRPGFIYQLISTDSIQAVIHPILHLGLSNEMDIDAFEFAWLYDTAAQRNGLALVFSVSVDDPFDVTSYTGGLDPGILYASFLNGTYFEMAPAVKPGNVDALTFVCEPLNAPGSTFITPIITGSKNLAENFPFKLYPNPTYGNVWLEFFMSNSGSVQANVMDVNGREVWNSGLMNHNLDNQKMLIPTGSLSNGVYFVEMRIAEGEKTSVARKKFTVVR